MSDRIAFDNPKELGCFDLRTTQKNKVMPFKSVEGVFLSNAEIRLYSNSRLIKTYNPLTVTGTNQQGQEKTASVTFQGADFETFKGKTLKGEGMFFVDGDLEVTFELAIK